VAFGPKLDATDEGLGARLLAPNLTRESTDMIEAMVP
jgi:hypothetical protein